MAPPEAELRELRRLLGRVVSGRVADAHECEDIVQEALERTLSVRPRLADDVVAPYAVAVARNLAAAHHARHDLDRRHRHRLVDLTDPPSPEDLVLGRADRAAVRVAVAALPDAERSALLGHVIDGHDTAALARATGTTPGGVAARLARARARARVDYVLALRRQILPTAQCRPVLLAISAADARRQRAVAADEHLLTCAVCPALVVPLAERSSALAGLLPLPLLLLVPRLRQAGPSAQAAAAGATTVLVGGALVAIAGIGGRPGHAPAVTAGRTGGSAAASPGGVGPTPGGGARATAEKSPAQAAGASPPLVAASGGATGPGGTTVPAPTGSVTAASTGIGRAVVDGPSFAVSGIVDDVPAGYGFWLRVDGADHYVRFTGLPARRVRLGDHLVLASARLRPVNGALLDDPNEVEPADRGRVSRARTYLDVAAADIRFARDGG